jgi:hypothetical protein
MADALISEGAAWVGNFSHTTTIKNAMTANLNIDTIRARAAAFAKEFSKSSYEMGEAQDFIRDLCQVFGLNHRRAVRFEERVKKLRGRPGRIDGFFPGLLLVEMKSAGEDLDKAYRQATEYFPGLKDAEMPRYVLVSDFANLHLYDLETRAPRLEIKLADFPRHIEPFLFMAGYETIAVQKEQEANERAAEKMAGLHDAIKATGYEGKDLETYLVRLLFCLFAEDTGLFGENGCFLDLLINHTKADGSDLHGVLTSLFDTLNRAQGKRPKNLPEHLAKFPHVNGALFKDGLAQCYFDEAARKTLIECAQLDWSQISPAIFGSLFQAIMHFDDEAAAAKTKKRREFGAHYTSEANILKAIKPLFLDSLREEFEKIRRDKKKLEAFHKRLATLNFFDPACGCGNFLVIAYRELRLLELDTIEAIWGKTLTGHLDIDTLILCNVDRFHGIEIDGSAAQIAKVALWLTDHQMNLRVQRFGNYFKRLPLGNGANIVCGNALRMDWAGVLPPEKCSYIMGNPPFVGKKEQTAQQKADLAPLFSAMKGAGVLDYVTAWHVKAARYIKANPAVPVAFVSTNSICQGEQVGVLWSWLLNQGVKIRFAHRTFQWSNEGKGVAAVHCIIVGFGLEDVADKWLFDYETPKSEPIAIKAKNINPYLVNAADLVILNRRFSVSPVPPIAFGSMPNDGGHLMLSPEERADLIALAPKAADWIKSLLGSVEFINGKDRYCLWLAGISPGELRAMPAVLKRVEATRDTRLASPRPATQALAATPTLFGEIRQPTSQYLAIPKTSSENRDYIPIAFLQQNIIANTELFTIAGATLYHLGVLSSIMHMAFVRNVCGRLKSDYRYSSGIVYNNFPWPTPADAQKKAIEAKAQAVLDARAAHPNATLADLYDPLAMPPDLAKAHAQLDKAVDAAYGYKGGKEDAARVAFLFELYRKLIAPSEPAPETETQPAAPVVKRAGRAKKAAG